ncbi:hypothetical protein [Halobacteriovorax sp. JY17]|uniref:hypothetical protein n=1 Tax=Halobacteriovorax sp. JY17 TaxID=2014617 RepID=UPI000C3D6486|nr:hypothetical protein [Halobacteriovorax sp. JY17]PIK13895.1 MAG: hypothetical protein CES88_12990 [Halobacteriovorax sp. JY17]
MRSLKNNGRVFVITILVASGLLVNRAFSKVEAPNYDFTLKKLEPFTPGKSIAELPKELGKGEITEDKGDTKIIRYNLVHARYNFPIYVQEKKGIILDFYARFPTYFLHDTFHQSLINKFGKQTKYHRQENDALYLWENVNGIKVIYSGACTVTCYPNYISYIQVTNKKGDFVPLIKKFSNNFLGKKTK